MYQDLQEVQMPKLTGHLSIGVIHNLKIYLQQPNHMYQQYQQQVKKKLLEVLMNHNLEEQTLQVSILLIMCMNQSQVTFMK